MAQQKATDYLDPESISQGKHLGMMARQVVEGYRVGEHRSPFRGFAIEFSQHREYVPGDDTRHLDWKVLGRSDRYYIKQYEQDTNYVAHLIVDGSESMAYGSGKISKLHYAKALAATLAYVILMQRDAVSLAVFDDETRETVQRTDSMAKIQLIMDRLASFECGRPTDLKRALDTMLASLRSRGIVILISDFLDSEEALIDGLRQFRFKGSEVIVFQVLDPQELEFNFKGAWTFEGLEGGEKIQAMPSDFRKAYLKEMNAFRDRVRLACETNGVHYVLANTSHPLAETLGGYLAFRQKVTAR